MRALSCDEMLSQLFKYNTKQTASDSDSTYHTEENPGIKQCLAFSFRKL